MDGHRKTNNRLHKMFRKPRFWKKGSGAEKRQSEGTQRQSEGTQRDSEVSDNGGTAACKAGLSRLEIKHRCDPKDRPVD